MRFWLYVNNEKHSFVEGERVPDIGETIIYRDEQSSSLTKGTVEDIATEVMSGRDLANPVEMVCHVFVRPM
jgi:hypothetical protein